MINDEYVLHCEVITKMFLSLNVSLQFVSCKSKQKLEFLLLRVFSKARSIDVGKVEVDRSRSNDLYRRTLGVGIVNDDLSRLQAS